MRLELDIDDWVLYGALVVAAVIVIWKIASRIVIVRKVLAAAGRFWRGDGRGRMQK